MTSGRCYLAGGAGKIDLQKQALTFLTFASPPPSPPIRTDSKAVRKAVRKAGLLQQRPSHLDKQAQPVASMAASSRRDVVLNIYELTDERGSGSWMRRVGLGAWHTGVEVGGVEYTFAQNGVFFHVPKTPMVAAGQVIKLKESMPMGEHVGSANEVRF